MRPTANRSSGFEPNPNIRLANENLALANNLLSQTQKLMQRVDSINQNQKFSEKIKLENTKGLKSEIQKNFDTIDKLLSQVSKAVERQYQLLRTLRPRGQKELKVMTEKLKQVQQSLLLSRSPSAPLTDPLRASLPDVPKDKVVLDKSTEDKIVKTAVTFGWPTAVKQIREHCKAKKVSEIDAKTQVKERLERMFLQQKGEQYEKIFGKKLRDLSENEEPSTSNTRKLTR